MKSQNEQWEALRSDMASMHERAYSAERERGRRECEATHDELAGSFFDSGYEQGAADAFDRGLRSATLLSLGAWALAWLAWRWWMGR